jgi:hypothetical protein
MKIFYYIVGILYILWISGTLVNIRKKLEDLINAIGDLKKLKELGDKLQASSDTLESAIEANQPPKP